MHQLCKNLCGIGVVVGSPATGTEEGHSNGSNISLGSAPRREKRSIGGEPRGRGGRVGIVRYTVKLPGG